MFECQVELLGVARLVVRENPDDATARVIGRGQVHRRNRGETVADATCHDEIPWAETVDRSIRDVPLQAEDVASVTGSVVEDSEAAAQHGLARQGVSKSETGRKT